MRSFIVLSAFASALAVGVVPPVEAEAQSNQITLRVCNRSNVVAQVAVSYQPVGSGTFFNEGWFNVNPNQCRDVAQTTNAYMYGYAEVEGSDTDGWSGNHDLCVEVPGPYEFWDNGSTYCESWQETRGFVTLHAERFGVFTWNLNP